MLRTILLGSCVSVQGVVEKILPDGRMSVRVGHMIYTGKPVTRAA